MSRKIIGVTVGTPINPAKIEEELKPVKTVNGVAPDENGNVVVTGGGTVDMSGYATKDFVANEISKIDVSSQISTKVDKSSVVNNFVTTEEGFVADARTVQLLNENTKVKVANVNGMRVAYNKQVVSINTKLVGVVADSGKWCELGTLPDDCPFPTSYMPRSSGTTYDPAGYSYIEIENRVIKAYFPNTMKGNNAQLFFNLTYIV